MDDLSFFDVHCEVGRRSAPRPEQIRSENDIAESLAHAGIDRALIYHATARDYDPRSGNDSLVETTAKFSQFESCFVVLPESTQEFPAGDELIRYLGQGGARAVKLYPKNHSFGLGQTWCGNLFGALSESQIPVLIDFSQTDWNEIDGVLNHNPDLTMIVVRPGYRCTRWVYPMFAARSGLKLETSWLQTHLVIEDISEKFGAERLLFGTALPEASPGAAVTPIIYSEIPDVEKKKIAGGNLDTILWKGGD